MKIIDSKVVTRTLDNKELNTRKNCKNDIIILH